MMTYADIAQQEPMEMTYEDAINVVKIMSQKLINSLAETYRIEGKDFILRKMKESEVKREAAMKILEGEEKDIPNRETKAILTLIDLSVQYINELSFRSGVIKYSLDTHIRGQIMSKAFFVINQARSMDND